MFLLVSPFLNFECLFLDISCLSNLTGYSLQYMIRTSTFCMPAPTHIEWIILNIILYFQTPTIWDKWNKVITITIQGSFNNGVEIKNSSNNSKNQSIHWTWLMQCYFVKTPSTNCQGKMVLLRHFVTFQ